jgi:hypothetical protein
MFEAVVRLRRGRCPRAWLEKGKLESQPHSNPTTSDVLYITALVARPRQSTRFEAAVSGRLGMVWLSRAASHPPTALDRTRGTSVRHAGTWTMKTSGVAPELCTNILSRSRRDQPVSRVLYVARSAFLPETRNQLFQESSAAGWPPEATPPSS